jgi:hypothetical protein
MVPPAPPRCWPLSRRGQRRGTTCGSCWAGGWVRRLAGLGCTCAAKPGWLFSSGEQQRSIITEVTAASCVSLTVTFLYCLRYCLQAGEP